jgi:ribosomal-protein-alanine N-acetyltransferase
MNIPTLHSERLVLRPLEMRDAPQMLLLRSNPNLMKYIPRPLTLTIEDAKKKIRAMHLSMLKNGNINWALTLKDSDEMIGVMGFATVYPEHKRAEIGYMMLEEHHGKGYLTEILPKIIQYAFDTMGMHSLEAIIDPRNTASEKVLIKLGFRKEAHFIENHFFNGEFIDSVHYCLLNDLPH